MIDRIPITRVHQLEGIETEECIIGYLDGFNGEPEPGDNRSYSYWHGWRNGAVDGGHRPKDPAQAALVHDYWKRKAVKCGTTE